MDWFGEYALHQVFVDESRNCISNDVLWENAAILHKHYVVLTGEPLSEAYLPIIEEDDIDVGGKL